MLQNRSQKNQSLARLGEALICSELQKQGWRILGQNFRRYGTELDILAQKGGTLAVVEVKTRRNFYHQTLKEPVEELITPRKKQSLCRGVHYFLMESTIQPQTIRFDLAVVSLNQENKNPKIYYYVDLGIQDFTQ